MKIAQGFWKMPSSHDGLPPLTDPDNVSSIVLGTGASVKVNVAFAVSANPRAWSR